jgi:hypothetical protein
MTPMAARELRKMSIEDYIAFDRASEERRGSLAGRRAREAGVSRLARAPILLRVVAIAALMLGCGAPAPPTPASTEGRIERFSVDGLIAMLGHAGVAVRLTTRRSKHAG